MTTDSRRNGDRLISKLVALWPVFVTVGGIIAMIATVKTKVEDHEVRINHLESSMSVIQSNTNRLVDELLDKK